MKLILFDIDGTLIHSGGSGKQGMIQAFDEIFGIPDGFDGISMAGKTDPLIIYQALTNHKINATPEQIDQFKQLYFSLLSHNLKMDLPNKRIYPGVKELLQQLHQHPHVILGLLTGNWQKGAEIKLNYFNLYQFFDFGAFGDDSIDRDELLPFALQRCKHCSKNEIDASQVVVVGDTPNDVQCAKVHGAKAMGVATGSYSEETLASKGADWVTRDLSATQQILSWIFS